MKLSSQFDLVRFIYQKYTQFTLKALKNDKFFCCHCPIDSSLCFGSEWLFILSEVGICRCFRFRFLFLSVSLSDYIINSIWTKRLFERKLLAISWIVRSSSHGIVNADLTRCVALSSKCVSLFVFIARENTCWHIFTLALFSCRYFFFALVTIITI